jgi:hypothetical protein
MPYIEMKDATALFCRDRGRGKPVVRRLEPEL